MGHLIDPFVPYEGNKEKKIILWIYGLYGLEYLGPSFGTRPYGIIKYVNVRF